MNPQGSALSLATGAQRPVCSVALSYEHEDPNFSKTIAGLRLEGEAIELGRAVYDGKVEQDAVVRVPLATSNRHGLIAGATGTGKTRTLQLIAEQLSAAGVPVVAADMKGDLSGIAQPGEAGSPAEKRAAELGQDWTPTGFPVEYLSLGGIGPGVPVRATVSDFGPLLLAKILEANETQEQSLSLVFRYADEQGLAILDSPTPCAAPFSTPRGKEPKRGGASPRETASSTTLSIGRGGNEFFGRPQSRSQTVCDCAEVAASLLFQLPAVQTSRSSFRRRMMWISRSSRAASGVGTYQAEGVFFSTRPSIFAAPRTPFSTRRQTVR